MGASQSSSVEVDGGEQTDARSVLTPTASVPRLIQPDGDDGDQGIILMSQTPRERQGTTTLPPSRAARIDPKASPRHAQNGVGDTPSTPHDAQGRPFHEISTGWRMATQRSAALPPELVQKTTLHLSTLLGHGTRAAYEEEQALRKAATTGGFRRELDVPNTLSDAPLTLLQRPQAP